MVSENVKEGTESQYANSKRPQPWLDPHRWQKGQSGNPAGRPRRKSITEIVNELLDKPIASDSEVTQRELLCEKLIEMANNGHKTAISELLARLDPATKKAEISVTESVRDSNAILDRLREVVKIDSDDPIC